MRILLLACIAVWCAQAQTKRVLFFSRTDGFRHGSIEVAKRALSGLDPEIAVTVSENLSDLAPEALRAYDAVFFYTSGELPLSPVQRQGLLDYVRAGGGFGGAHSATDTLYSWPEYGELIGGYFDGHPWVQNVQMDIEDPDHPATRDLAPSWEALEEVYQFRAFSRESVRVLMTLDVTTVNLKAQGVNRTDQDFALTWVRDYGQGRVFYTALGHFDEMWRDTRFHRMLRGSLRWLTKLEDASAAPRGSAAAPRIDRVTEAAQFNYPGLISPGSLISVFGANLSTGSVMAFEKGSPRLAGATVAAGSTSLPLIFASPAQLNAYVPPGTSATELKVTAGVRSGTLPVVMRPVTPGIFAVSLEADALVIWCAGLGANPDSVQLRLDGSSAPIRTVRPQGTIPGLYRLETARPAGLPAEVQIEIQGETARYRPRA
jgi:type 1 glutamine amidotransferase